MAPIRPIRATAGKGGHLAQLEKIGLALEPSQHASERFGDLLNNEPTNKAAPTPRRSRKNKTKRAAKVSLAAGGLIVY